MYVECNCAKERSYIAITDISGAFLHAELLYLSQRSRQYIQTVIAFLCTRVQKHHIVANVILKSKEQAGHTNSMRISMY